MRSVLNLSIRLAPGRRTTLMEGDMNLRRVKMADVVALEVCFPQLFMMRGVGRGQVTGVCRQLRLDVDRP